MFKKLKTNVIASYLLLLQQTSRQLWKGYFRARLTWNYNRIKYVTAKTNWNATLFAIKLLVKTSLPPALIFSPKACLCYIRSRRKPKNISVAAERSRTARPGDFTRETRLSESPVRTAVRSRAAQAHARPAPPPLPTAPRVAQGPSPPHHSHFVGQPRVRGERHFKGDLRPGESKEKAPG